MRIGTFAGDLGGPNSTVQAAVDAARAAADLGFTSFWMPQIFGLDALTALGVIGAQVPGIELGTAVVPVYPRHPSALAQQALTVQSASAGRLTLGIGLSHQVVIEHMMGYSFDKPASYMEEYLASLAPLLRGEQTDVDGDRVTTHMKLDIAAPTPPGLIVAALGERMLHLAAEHADGTATWMTGPRTLAEHTVPTLRAAAGADTKRVVAALPVAVTDDVAGARARAAEAFKIYGVLPSYRAMLDREGCATPGRMALIGDADTVAAKIASFAGLGVTTFAAKIFGTPGERAATRALVAALAR